jgi:hypothetical protein
VTDASPSVDDDGSPADDRGRTTDTADGHGRTTDTADGHGRTADTADDDRERTADAAARGRPCPACGAPMVHRHCEYVCPNHGVVMDCADTFYD